MFPPVKPKKPIPIQEGSYRDLFFKKFGKHIHEYAAFQRAVEGLSVNTTKGYRQLLIPFFLHINKDPDTVIVERQHDLMDKDILQIERYERIVKAYIKEIDSKNKDAVTHLNRIQGFFTNNSKRLSLDISKLKIAAETKRRKYSPSREDVQKLISYAAVDRDRLIIALMFQNGVLPVDLVGLRIGDYPVEPWMYYKRKRSKTGKFWHGVSTPDICFYLKAYLRIRGGKSGESLFFGREGAMSSSSLSGVVAAVIERSGLGVVPDFIPKCLRDGFEDVLVDADVNVKTKQAMMGHGGNISHEYGSAKKTEERVVEAMRKAYPLLCLSEQPVTTSGLNEQVLKEMASMLPALKILLQQQQQNNKQ
jgi:integrase